MPVTTPKSWIRPIWGMVELIINQLHFSSHGPLGFRSQHLLVVPLILTGLLSPLPLFNLFWRISRCPPGMRTSRPTFNDKRRYISAAFVEPALTPLLMPRKPSSQIWSLRNLKLVHRKTVRRIGQRQRLESLHLCFQTWRGSAISPVIFFDYGTTLVLWIFFHWLV